MEFNENMFGKTDERVRKVEKYSFSVLTMQQFAGKGTSRKFTLNKAAVALLGLEDGSAVGFVFQEGNTYLANTTGTGAVSYNVTKGNPRSFSDGKIYDFISKTMGITDRVLSEDVDMKLEQLNDSTFNGYPVLEVTLLTNDEEEEGKTSVEDAVSEKQVEVVQEVAQSPFSESVTIN